MDKPRLFSTFMLWMLAQLYETLPEVGDLPKPKLCFFFDEAHLLFDDASDALLDQIERTARLIRSKGVGVYFVTQAPTDVPSSVLAQLGNRVQHALRAFTPDDADALRKTARTFPMTTYYDVEKTITSLGTGEALVTVLSPPRRADAARRDPPAAARLAHGRPARCRSAGPDRGGVAAGQVRPDDRPPERLRDDHRTDRIGEAGRRRGGGPAGDRRRGCRRPPPAGLNTMTPAEQDREVRARPRRWPRPSEPRRRPGPGAATGAERTREMRGPDGRDRCQDRAAG